MKLPPQKNSHFHNLVRKRTDASKRVHHSAGFTLIESVAALTFAAVLGVLLLPLIGSGLTGSRDAMKRLPDTHSLRSEMDRIWEDYRSTTPTNLSALSVNITNTTTFNIIDNSWVEFDVDGNEISVAGPSETLKITLANSQGEQLTSYFFPIPRADENP